MPENLDLGRHVEIRRELASAEARAVEARRRVVELRAARDRMVASGATAGTLRDVDAEIEVAVRDDRLVRGRIRDRLNDLGVLSDELLDRFRTPEQLVATLDGRTPVALLPVRLETRFFDRGQTLRIRIFPDQLHLDAHEPEVTTEERDSGIAYWTEVLAAGEDADRRALAWRELAAGMGAPRARYLAEALRPAVDPATGQPRFPEVPTKAEAWTRPARATALPDRWVAIGRRGRSEVFRAWGRPVPDWLPTTPASGADEDDDVELDPDAGPPFGEELRWLTDYDEAEKLGMAITVRSGQGGVGDLRRGLTQLVVLGVDWTLEPADAAVRLDDLLTAHRFTDGLSFVPPGTPTNQTGKARAGGGVADGRTVAALDPDAPPAGAADDGSVARRLADGLGLPDAAALEAVPNAGMAHASTASLLHDVLWAAALGYYLDELWEPAIGDATIARLRRFVVANLHPGGPFGTLRVGSQPYGVLPVVAAGAYTPSRGQVAEGQLAGLLAKGRLPMLQAAASLPRMGRSQDPGEDLVALLQRTPLAQRARFRPVTGPGWWANVAVPHDPFHELAWVAWTSWLVTRPARIDHLRPDEEAYRLNVPWVQGGDADPKAPLTPDYLTQMAQVLATREGREQLLARQDGSSILEALAAFAATEELDRAMAEVAKPARVDEPEGGPPRVTLATPELLGIEPDEPVERGQVRVQTHEQLAQVVLPRATGGKTLSVFVADHLRHRDPNVLRIQPGLAELARYTDALRELATRPAGELEHALRGYLDATSHRPDAWFTALATGRLDEVRRRGAKGVHLGGWGIVEDLRPDRQPDSRGYVHAPSLQHAATTAILRAGHLSHRGDGGERFDLQLTSERVRAALPVLEGVAEGQPLAALLGYHLERAIHEDVLSLAQFILPLRELAPLRGIAGRTPAGAVESIAARDVVDGVRLVERFREEGAAFLSELRPVPDADARGRLARHLQDVADIADAVGDMLVAEVVHQTVTGNHERAGAALAALDRQQRPPELEFVRTPRTGEVYAQRVLTLMTTDAVDAGWAGLPGDVRAAASPRANAWVSRLLPPAAAIGFAGLLLAPDGTEETLSATVADLGLSPLSLVAVGAAGGKGSQPSELEQRIAAALVGDRVVTEGSELAVLDTPPDGADVGLGALRSTLGWLRSLLARSRPANPADLAPPDETADRTVDVADLAGRADGVAAALGTAVEALRTAVAADPPDVAQLTAALALASACGVDGAVPQPGIGGDVAARAGALADQAQRTLVVGERRAEALVELAAALADADPAPDAAGLVDHHAARLRTVLGDGFPVLPRFTLAPPDERRDALAASLLDQSALVDGDPQAARTWLDNMALVRPETRMLADVLLSAELLGAPAGGADRVAVAQLPHVAGQRWNALPPGEGGWVDADVALVLHADGPLVASATLAGLVVDEWHETIPAAVETTAITFHYDAPAARAPQSVLLAVPPSADQDAWSLEGLLACVDEVMDLARMRGLTPDDMPMVGPFLPMTYLPHRFTKDRKPPPFHSMFERFKGMTLATGVVGKHYATMTIDQG